MARKVQKPNFKIDARGRLASSTRAAGNLNGRVREKPLTLGVFHGTVSQDAAGVRDLAGVVGYWQGFNAGGSAHGITDADGNSAYTVDITRRAPHCGGMNGVSFGWELVSNVPGWLRRLYWSTRPKQMHELARVVAWANLEAGLPIQEAVLAGTGAGTHVAQPGWTTHAELGRRHAGTDHTDPGPWFPMRKVLAMARWYAANGWENGVFNVKPSL